MIPARSAATLLPGGAILIAGALLAPTELPAQQAGGGDDAGSEPVSPPGVVDVRVGTASPRGSLEGLADAGLLLGAGAGYRLLSRAELRAEMAWQNLGRDERRALGGAPGPRVDLVHYTAVLLLELTDPVISRWEIELLGGAGGTRVHVREGPAAVPDFSGHRPTLQAGGQVGYDFTDQATLFLRGGAYRILAEEGQPPAYLGSELLLTHEAGLRIRF